VRRAASVVYSFADLLTIRQAAAELAGGTPLRVVLRTLLAERQGQLALDFQPGHAVRGPMPRARRSSRSPARQEPAAARRPPRRSVPDASAPRVTRRSTPTSAAIRSVRSPRGTSSKGPASTTERARTMMAAAAAYRKALVVDPDLVPAIVNLANIHYGQDEPVEAQALYERAIALDPECFEAHFNLGNIHHDLGRYSRAVVCYRTAVAAEPVVPGRALLPRGGAREDGAVGWPSRTGGRTRRSRRTVSGPSWRVSLRTSTPRVEGAWGPGASAASVKVPRVQ
jgi:tetratricopeptide (TPR) repeat protein